MTRAGPRIAIAGAVIAGLAYLGSWIQARNAAPGEDSIGLGMVVLLGLVMLVVGVCLMRVQRRNQ